MCVSKSLINVKCLCVNYDHNYGQPCTYIYIYIYGKLQFIEMAISVSGVGIGMVIVSCIVCIYYNVVIAWTLYYLFVSFRVTLPWGRCDNYWNSPNCVDTGKQYSLERVSVNGHGMSNADRLAVFGVLTNASGDLGGTADSVVYNSTQARAWMTSRDNTTAVGLDVITDSMSASEEFWE